MIQTVSLCNHINLSSVISLSLFVYAHLQACTNQLEAWQVLNESRPLCRLQLLERAEQCIGVVHHFTKCYNDALCVHSFSQWAKLCKYVSSSPAVCCFVSFQAYEPTGNCAMSSCVLQGGV